MTLEPWHLAIRSSLVDLCHSISMDFAGNPPLFSKPPNWSPDMDMGPPPPPQHAQHSTPQHEFHENPMNWCAAPAAPLQGFAGLGHWNVPKPYIGCTGVLLLCQLTCETVARLAAPCQVFMRIYTTEHQLDAQFWVFDSSNDGLLQIYARTPSTPEGGL